MRASIKAAVKNIAEFGDTDIFPYSFERHIFRDKPTLLEKALEDLHKNFNSHLCDIADFYARVYHHRVENALKWLKTKSEAVKRIVELLGKFTDDVSYGLPVGVTVK